MTEATSATSQDRQINRLLGYHKRTTSYLVLPIAVAVFGFIYGSFYVEIDETARTTGEVIAESRVQIIQSVDGGVISEMLVSEGDQVQQGQILARLYDERIRAEVGEIQARLASLKLKAARLRAETFSEDMLSFPSEIAADFPVLANAERALFEQRKTGYQDELRILNAAYDLAQREFEMVQSLIEQDDANEAELIRVQKAINDADAKIVTKKNQFFEEAQANLSRAEDEIAQNEQILTRRLQELKATEFRAMTNGIVKNISVTSLGGVLHAGEELMQIVPVDDKLIMEVKLVPTDIARVERGLPVTIRLDPFDYTIWGHLSGSVTYVSADTIKEESASGTETFYRAYVEMDSNLTASGREIQVLPGMTGQVDIRTGTRTLYDFLMKPIRKTLSEAFSER